MLEFSLIRETFKHNHLIMLASATLQSLNLLKSVSVKFARAKCTDPRAAELWEVVFLPDRKTDNILLQVKRFSIDDTLSPAE